MRAIYFSIFLALFYLGGCQPDSGSRMNEPVAQQPQDVMLTGQEFQVMFYNVENLFDTIDDPAIRDEEFTPESDKLWNTARYVDKLNRLAQVIRSVDSLGTVGMIGLAEVENRDVVEDLVAYSTNADKQMGIAHINSKDARGIDVALLYDSAYFIPNKVEAVPVALPDTGRTTRDILWVSGTFGGSIPVDVFVNHWPSRWGGQEKSEPGRIAAATVLHELAATLLREDPDRAIIIMGDFNDYPYNKSIQEILGAGMGPNYELTNLMADTTFPDSVGSYNYRGDWGFLDQIILSPALEGQVDTLYAHRRDYMIYYNEKYKYHAPSRSYSRNTYYGGYSDHLPVVAKLTLK